MQVDNLWAWVNAAGPLVLGAAFLRLPEWLGGTPAAPVLDASRRGAGDARGDARRPVEPVAPVMAPPRRATSEHSLVDEMLSQGRYALLLRRQLVGNLTPSQLGRTREALADGMCLVPEGEVTVTRGAGLPLSEGELRGHGEATVRVEAYFLDRYPVTNAQFQHFVLNGGYEQMAIWDPEIWPAVLDFVDRSGQPGPRYWYNAQCEPGEENHPVVGISWYEAAAYARWAGKRLPTDAEWVKAGSWPVSIAGHPLLERRYPWGDAMDHRRANLWASQTGHTVSVEAQPGGVSVGGVQQLIGNVWEWTSESFALESEVAAPQPMQQKMKIVRGGAFDTYLDCQATCQFRSGDRALARKHNIGFRLAISRCDLAKEDNLSAASMSEESELAQGDHQS